MNGCDAPLRWEQLVAYWADDLSEPELSTLEEHLLACAQCSAASGRVAQLTQTLHELLPPLLSAAQLAALRARGLVVLDNPMQPGERRQVVFVQGVDILLHRLQGLDLTRAERVSFTLHDEDSGALMIALPNAPFERASGEVLVACQRHYASLPPNTVAELVVRQSDGEISRTRYTILHVFASGS